LAVLRTFRSLRRLRGGVIDGVNRKSLGEIYFPLAVGLVYLLSAGDPLTFCIPMLILSLADAAAALVGERYGALRYPTAGQRKSLEGSVAFFTVAFLSAHIPLLLFTNAGRPANLLISLTLALLLTLLEAMAPGGLDNLGIPLVALLLLRSLLGLDVAALVARLGVAVLLAALVALLARRGIPLNQEGSPERSRLSSRFTPGRTEGSGDGIV
jgi:phytol kinase